MGIFGFGRDDDEKAETAVATATPAEDEPPRKKIDLKFRKFSDRELERIAKETLKDGGLDIPEAEKKKKDKDDNDDRDGQGGGGRGSLSNDFNSVARPPAAMPARRPRGPSL
ncbi:MAG: hypothetical protein GC185_06095 [Alphaproteobacteria bacterium]|nr:hypothetical protein [Alphaproteobacteria bacterium]